MSCLLCCPVPSEQSDTNVSFSWFNWYQLTQSPLIYSKDIRLKTWRKNWWKCQCVISWVCMKVLWTLNSLMSLLEHHLYPIYQKYYELKIWLHTPVFFFFNLGLNSAETIKKWTMIIIQSVLHSVLSNISPGGYNIMNLSSFLLERKSVMIVCLTKLDLYTYKYSRARKKKKPR